MIGIWGSCVTRDIFELGGVWDEPLSYHARSSWISQASPAGREAPAPVPDGTGFGHRMVREDLQSSILDQTVSAEPDLVIFDLIDERLDVVATDAGSYSVNEWYGRLELEDDLRAAATNTSEFRDDAREEAFRDAVATLAPRWLEALPETRFALHQAWYTARSVDPETVFYTSAPAHVEWSNRRLAAHYATLREAFGSRLHVIEPDRRAHLVADPGHKWGLAHFHYVPSYYEQALRQIRAIAAGPLHSSGLSRLRVPTHKESGATAPTSRRALVNTRVRGVRRRLRQLSSRVRATASAARPSP